MSNNDSERPGAAGDGHRILIAFTGAGYAGEALAHLAAELEGRGHAVELVSYGGLAAEAARNLAERGMRGLRAALRTVTRGGSEGEGEDLIDKERGHKLDAVVATSVELDRAVRRAAGDDTVRLGLMADLDWEPAWTDSAFDALIVPHPVFRELCLRRSWPEEAILAGGVPLSRNFCRPLDVEAIRSRFGLSPDNGRVVMVVAEGVEPTRLERLVFQLSLVDQRIQPIFYVGTDKLAGEALRKAAGEYGVLARMFGVVDNLEEYYAASDLVLSTVAHPLLYALLALDKPVVLFDADPGARPVAAFLEDESAARIVPDVLRLGSEIDALLASEEQLEQLREGARKVVDQKGVLRIADAIESAIKDRAALRERRQPPTASESNEQQETLGGGGAFEVIGSGTSPAAPPPTTTKPASTTSETGAATTGGPTRDVNDSVWGGASGETTTNRTADRIASGARVYETHQTRRLSRAEAQEEMAALILMERDVEKRLSDATRYVSRWEGRLDLARRAGEPELSKEAERFLDNYRREEAALLRELDRIRDQKDKLRRRVHGVGGSSSASGASASLGSTSAEGGRTAEIEGRFRSMELDQDLDRLKGRLRDEFGED